MFVGDRSVVRLSLVPATHLFSKQECCGVLRTTSIEEVKLNWCEETFDWVLDSAPEWAKDPE
jgi:hypothetical protein